MNNNKKTPARKSALGNKHDNEVSTLKSTAKGTIESTMESTAKITSTLESTTKSKEPLFTMMQTCKVANMTYQTLKFYCNEGLVPNVKRDKNNRRVFDAHDVDWIKSLTCLKKCGMSIAEMKEYLALCLEGESSIPERKIMLENVQKRLVAQKQEIEESIAFIDWKQGFYDDILTGKTKYFSNLTKAD